MHTFAAEWVGRWALGCVAPIRFFTFSRFVSFVCSFTFLGFFAVAVAVAVATAWTAVAVRAIAAAATAAATASPATARLTFHEACKRSLMMAPGTYSRDTHVGCMLQLSVCS